MLAPNQPTRRGLRAWHEAGYTTELLPVIPLGAKLTEGTKVKPGGKVPGVLTAQKTWSGLGGQWSKNLHAEVSDLKKWDGWKPDIGAQSRKLIGADNDITKAPLARKVSGLIEDMLGMGPIRGRSGGSSKCLHMFRTDEPLRKVRLAFTDKDGDAHAVELLATGQFYVVEGQHKDGDSYIWRGDHPCDVGADNLPAITAADVEKFFAALRELLAREGCTLDKDAATSAQLASGTRKQLTDASRWCPGGPQPVLNILAATPPERFATRDELVQFLPAVKASLGSTHEEHRGAIFDWALQYPGAEEDFIAKIWDSITDAALGWDWLSSAFGAELAAQDDFAEPLSAAERGTMLAHATPKAEPKRPALIFPFSEQGAPTLETRDFVEDLLCDGQLSLCFGESGVGKTFVVSSLAMSVALGWAWHGRDIERGGVVYIAMEGAAGLRQRIAAFRQELGTEETADARLAVISGTINFRDKDSVTGLIAAVNEAAPRLGGVRLIVADTVSRGLAGGNENSSEDMGAFVTAADRIRTETGAHLLLIHHSGKDDAKGARGHSLLRAAVDTEIKIERTEGGLIVARVTKQRDLEARGTFTFKLRTVVLGVNRRGKTITNCVVEPAELPPPPLSDAERDALEILNQMLPEGDETTVPVGPWRKAVMQRLEDDGVANPVTRRGQCKRTVDGLTKRGVIRVTGERVGLI